jgi:hypothetical protein
VLPAGEISEIVFNKFFDKNTIKKSKAFAQVKNFHIIMIIFLAIFLVGLSPGVGRTHGFLCRPMWLFK